jgi:hypothetical protein
MLTKLRYYWITQAFESTSGSISNLVNGINEMVSDCSDTTLLGSFMENHDNPRFPSLTSDLSLAKNAIAFTILQDGIPISKSVMRTVLNSIKTNNLKFTTAKNSTFQVVRFPTIVRLSGSLGTQPLHLSTASSHP